ncbi:hypothetical protein D3C76_1639140 [compost metagenome]
MAVSVCEPAISRLMVAPFARLVTVPPMVWLSRRSATLRMPSPKIGSSTMFGRLWMMAVISMFLLTTLPAESVTETPNARLPSLRAARSSGGIARLQVPSLPTLAV